MKISRAILASILALTSLRTFAADNQQIEISNAKLVLKQQYAELEDLKTQLKLAVKAGETNSVAFVISSALLGTGLILDILGVQSSAVTRITNLTLADSMIVIGTVGATASGVIVALDVYKIKQIEKRIEAQQQKILEASKGLL
ncbi:hypothetical protein [Bdellovibrio sp. HCB2-146]|uniref:hypothetical protein n=1 Tax=Bdellovibrio sp. HCB2-146 TaxID=3394362 RepID=UPI0039BC3EF2